LWRSKSEGAKCWLSVFTELKNRGVEDGCIARVEGLKGVPEAIEAVLPKTQVQLGIVHKVRLQRSSGEALGQSDPFFDRCDGCCFRGLAML
jgi:transposase-like protein